MSFEQTFDEAAERLRADGPAIERGRMIRSFGLKTGGKFFAFAREGELVVKLPAGRVAELVASGEGRPFDRGDGRPLREWVCLSPRDADECEASMREARAFVAG